MYPLYFRNIKIDANLIQKTLFWYVPYRALKVY